MITNLRRRTLPFFSLASFYLMKNQNTNRRRSVAACRQAVHGSEIPLIPSVKRISSSPTVSGPDFHRLRTTSEAAGLSLIFRGWVVVQSRSFGSRMRIEEFPRLRSDLFCAQRGHYLIRACDDEYQKRAGDLTDLCWTFYSRLYRILGRPLYRSLTMSLLNTHTQR